MQTLNPSFNWNYIGYTGCDTCAHILYADTKHYSAEYIFKEIFDKYNAIGGCNKLFYQMALRGVW